VTPVPSASGTSAALLTFLAQSAPVQHMGRTICLGVCAVGVSISTAPFSSAMVQALAGERLPRSSAGQLRWPCAPWPRRADWFRPYPGGAGPSCMRPAMALMKRYARGAQRARPPLPGGWHAAAQGAPRARSPIACRGRPFPAWCWRPTSPKGGRNAVVTGLTQMLSDRSGAASSPRPREHRDGDRRAPALDVFKEDIGEAAVPPPPPRRRTHLPPASRGGSRTGDYLCAILMASTERQCRGCREGGSRRPICLPARSHHRS